MADDGKRHPSTGTSESRSSEGWAGSALRAVVMLVAVVFALLIVPDRLLAYLAPRVTPNSRDLILAAWTAVAFVAMCFLFLALQRRRR